MTFSKASKVVRYPNSLYFGLKVVPTQVVWGHSIYYLGTWTLRVRDPKSYLPSSPLLRPLAFLSEVLRLVVLGCVLHKSEGHPNPSKIAGRDFFLQLLA